MWTWTGRASRGERPLARVGMYVCVCVSLSLSSSSSSDVLAVVVVVVGDCCCRLRRRYGCGESLAKTGRGKARPGASMVGIVICAVFVYFLFRGLVVVAVIFAREVLESWIGSSNVCPLGNPLCNFSPLGLLARLSQPCWRGCSCCRLRWCVGRKRLTLGAPEVGLTSWGAELAGCEFIPQTTCQDSGSQDDHASEFDLYNLGAYKLVTLPYNTPIPKWNQTIKLDTQVLGRCGRTHHTP